MAIVVKVDDVGRLDETSLLVVLAMAAVNRLVEDCGGRRIRLFVVTDDDVEFKSLMLPFSELEKTPLDSVPVEVAICSSLLLFSFPCLLLGDTLSNRLPSDLTVCHRGLDDDVTALELLFELILLMLFVAVPRSFETETDDDDDTSRALGLLLVTTRELTSFLSPVWTAVGGRIALILMELLPKGTALFMKTGSELLLGFKGTATPPAARRLVDIALVRARLVVKM